jgi:hypothetical protein
MANLLNVQLNVLNSYSAPALPAKYDATVAARDNAPGGNPITTAVVGLVQK